MEARRSTEALLSGSPAVNAAVPVAGVTTDQRGFYRPQGAAPDIGAFELQIHRWSSAYSGTASTMSLQRSSSPSASQWMPPEPRSIAEYRLVSAGPDHRFGTRDDRVIRIRSARYNAATLQVTLRPICRLPLHGTFQLDDRGHTTVGADGQRGPLLGWCRNAQAGQQLRDQHRRRSHSASVRRAQQGSKLSSLTGEDSTRPHARCLRR